MRSDWLLKLRIPFAINLRATLANLRLKLLSCTFLESPAYYCFHHKWYLTLNDWFRKKTFNFVSENLYKGVACQRTCGDPRLLILSFEGLQGPCKKVFHNRSAIFQVRILPIFFSFVISPDRLDRGKNFTICRVEKGSVSFSSRLTSGRSSENMPGDLVFSSYVLRFILVLHISLGKSWILSNTFDRSK